MNSAFITFRDTDNNDKLQYYILQRSYPHYLALLSHTPIENSLGSAAIGGYNLWVIGIGTLRGRMLPINLSQPLKDLQSTLDVMSSWYLANRIEINPNKYKKFKLATDVPSN
jgi:hypothetical protein